MFSQVVEDYLKAVWMLQQAESPVATSRIAERLSLTSAAVTAMVKRLAEQGLVRHEPYYGVRLTAGGELAALRIIRRHRVLELFLVEKLGYEWDGVHEEADRLEHAASDELIERLARPAGRAGPRPARQRHPQPRPARWTRSATRPWATWRRRVPAHPGGGGGRARPAPLPRLAEPAARRGGGALERSPFEGPVSVAVNGAATVISHALAQRIRVRPAADPAPEGEGG
jgi:DtxR family Mn-dependent transcriptional regulator